MKNKIKFDSSPFFLRFLRRTILSGSSLFLAMLANSALAGLDTWDPQGASGNAVGGTWENASWDTANQTGTATPVHFVEGDAANFAFGALGGSNSTFTVTMGINHTVAGIFNGPLTPKSCYLTLSGAGSITLPAGTGIQGFDTAGSTLGETIIDVPILGASTVTLVVEGGGQLFLNGSNTYTGGTDIGYSGTSGTGIVNFNNGSAFGTGPIIFSNCTLGAFAVEGSAAITIPNSLSVNAKTGFNYNLVGNAAGVTYSGNFALGTNSPVIGSSPSGNATSLDIFSGVISGTGGLTIYGGTGGTAQMEFNNAMTYTGATTITNHLTLFLGVNAAIGHSAVTVQTNCTLVNLNTGVTVPFGGALTFQASGGTGRTAAGATFYATGTNAGQINVASNLTLNSTPITINCVGALAGGTYRLISCAGSVSGSAATTATFTGASLPAGAVTSISTTAGAGGHVDLIVDVPPSITCPGDITTNATGQCGQTVGWSNAVATGYPAPVVTYTVPGPVTITSPFNFPPGTTTVTATANNGVGSAATCTFNVTVNETAPTAPANFPVGGVAASTSVLPMGKFFSLCTSALSSPSFSFASVTSPTANGATVTLTNNGTTLVYTAAPNLNPDTISYVLSDGCTTAPGTLTVTVAPSAGGNFGSATVSGSTLQLQFFGIPGQPYYLQQATSVNGPWSYVPGQMQSAGGNGTINFTIGPPVPSPSYYRTTTVPPA